MVYREKSFLFMAELFRLVKYCHLPRMIDLYWGWFLSDYRWVYHMLLFRVLFWLVFPVLAAKLFLWRVLDWIWYKIWILLGLALVVQRGWIRVETKLQSSGTEWRNQRCDLTGAWWCNQPEYDFESGAFKCFLGVHSGEREGERERDIYIEREIDR